MDVQVQVDPWAQAPSLSTAPSTHTANGVAPVQVTLQAGCVPQAAALQLDGEDDAVMLPSTPPEKWVTMAWNAPEVGVVASAS